ncbi:MAG: hypothetical protein FWF94_08415 [Oscillospiraceae bacterium]|nr:hypothetical protein [Oscillospiraceae bacterium]
MKIIRKITALLIAGAICIACTACTDLTTPEPQPDPDENQEIVIIADTESETEDDVSGGLVTSCLNGYIFGYDGYNVAVGSLADDLLEALGEPQDTFVDESCAFHGLDFMYFYPGVQFNTFSPADGEPDYILTIIFRDDTVSTPEGAFIGMAQEEVEEIYGTPTESNDVRIQYIKDGMSLSFIFDNDELIDITYYYDGASEFEVL